MQIDELYQVFLQNPSVQTDTRKIKSGDIYFALKGPNFNGNEFANNAIELGASWSIVDEVQYANHQQCILVDDVLKTLQELGLHHRRQLAIPIIAITGSNGKTTTKELIYTVLKTEINVFATKGNLNNHIGIPLTILSFPLDAEIGIVEMGANHVGEIAEYCTYSEPDFGIINNCGKAHLEGFGSLEGVKKAKGELFDYLRKEDKKIFVNSGLDYLMAMSEGINRITYGTSASDIEATGFLKQSFLHVDWVDQTITTNLTGIYNLPNVQVAIAVGHYFKIAKHNIISALENYIPDNSRSQVINRNGNILILDAYNANPSSMILALENFNLVDAKHKIVCLGSMKELGSKSLEEHQVIISYLEKMNLELVILVGPEFEQCDSTFQVFETSALASNYLKAEILPEPFAILVKGSRATAMEEVINFLD